MFLKEMVINVDVHCIRLIVLFLLLLFISIYLIIHGYILIYDYLQCFQLMAFSSQDLYIPKIYFRLLMLSGYHFFLTVQKFCIELKQKNNCVSKNCIKIFFTIFFTKFVYIITSICHTFQSVNVDTMVPIVTDVGQTALYLEVVIGQAGVVMEAVNVDGVDPFVIRVSLLYTTNIRELLEIFTGRVIYGIKNVLSSMTYVLLTTCIN